MAVQWLSIPIGTASSNLKTQGRALPDGVTRALEELDIELIRAHSTQAKGRVERHFGTCQDRWVKKTPLGLTAVR